MRLSSFAVTYGVSFHLKATCFDSREQFRLRSPHLSADVRIYLRTSYEYYDGLHYQCRPRVWANSYLRQSLIAHVGQRQIKKPSITSSTRRCRPRKQCRKAHGKGFCEDIQNNRAGNRKSSTQQSLVIARTNFTLPVNSII